MQYSAKARLGIDRWEEWPYILTKAGEQDVSIVALVDAKRWDKVWLAMPKFVESQICKATTVFLNKIDLVTEEKVNAVRQAILDIAPQATIYPSVALKEIREEYFLSLQ